MLRPAQLAACAAVVARHPDVAWVLDHAGKPPVAAGWGSTEAQEWARLIAALGRLPRLTIKLSGLTTMADLERWTTTDLEPWVDHLLEVAGPDRLAFGSDWPVSRRASEYGRTVGAVGELLGRLSPAEQALVLGGDGRARLPAHSVGRLSIRPARCAMWTTSSRWLRPMCSK
ncbi:amidohydrolase family protein [Nocardioides sp. TF02-7]|uniref:amidohydrolase family protein n=1 Tax=Nocardioides sp. TF02-7 TaxID=2917724 RepID=UPI001F0638D9|nr:amidohydrolase family protein [Nocardioides sp. TF02-7]UMG91251.1 amidohydrolase family protein [Nocardioides sp. TF02-7]